MRSGEKGSVERGCGLGVEEAEEMEVGLKQEDAATVKEENESVWLMSLSISYVLLRCVECVGGF